MNVVDISDRVDGAFCTKMLAAAGHEAAAFAAPSAGGSSVAADPWLTAYLRQGVTVLEAAASAQGRLAAADVVIMSSCQERSWPDDFSVRPLDPLEVVLGDFPEAGLYAGYRGGPLVEWASGGHLHITGLPDREPLAGPRHLPAYITGYAAAFAVELGLACRQDGPACSRIRLSTMELMAGIHQNSFTMLAGTGISKRRRRHPQPIYPMDIFECADGWASVAVVTDAQYDAFAAVVGEPALLLDPRFETPASRGDNSDAFDDVVAPWFRTRAVDDVVARLQRHHVPAVRLAFPGDVFDDPQLGQRGFWERAPGGGRMPGVPFRVSAEPAPSGPPVSTGPAKRTGLPLAGLTVLDATEFWSGPSCTRMLADFGATVIRVERPGSRWHPASYAKLADWKMNRGKLSVAVDLKTAEGAALVRRLAADADLFVENFRPGVMDRFGLGLSDLLPRSKPLVYLSLSGFGRSGPRAGWASFGPLLEAASSIQARTRYPGGPPMLLGHSLPDPVGGLLGAFVALAALRDTRRDGRSRRVDVSQLEAYVACCGEELLRASAGGAEPAAPTVSGVFATRGVDEWMVVEAGGDDGIRSLLSALGLGQEAADPPAAVARALSGMDRFEATLRLQSEGVVAFPVMSVADLAADTVLRGCGFLVDVALGSGSAPMPGVPLHGVAHRADIHEPAPLCGAHTGLVLRGRLGLTGEEIAALVERKVVAVAGAVPVAD